jgi:hypothetical protein
MHAHVHSLRRKGDVDELAPLPRPVGADSGVAPHHCVFLLMVMMMTMMMMMMMMMTTMMMMIMMIMMMINTHNMYTHNHVRNVAE